MAKQKHKMLARMKGGKTQVKLLLRHPMETGNRKDSQTGLKVPRDFIRELRCEHNGSEVLSSVWGWGVSRNPYLSFNIIGAKVGDRVVVFWDDNKGGSDSLETRVR